MSSSSSNEELSGPDAQDLSLDWVKLFKVSSDMAKWFDVPSNGTCSCESTSAQAAEQVSRGTERESEDYCGQGVVHRSNEVESALKNAYPGLRKIFEKSVYRKVFLKEDSNSGALSEADTVENYMLRRMHMTFAMGTAVLSQADLAAIHAPVADNTFIETETEAEAEAEAERKQKKNQKKRNKKSNTLRSPQKMKHPHQHQHQHQRRDQHQKHNAQPRR